MLLCIDIGNTNIVIGLFKEEELIHSFRMQSSLQMSADEYGIQMVNMLRFFNLDFQGVAGMIISSVVPGLDTAFEQIAQKYFNIKPMFVIPGVKTGIKVRIDNPKQLGADLLVGAVGGVAKYGVPLIVVDMGTAITLMAVNDQKEILGGMIYPGIKTAFSSLVKHTSRLEEVRMNPTDSIIGRDTASSIQSGMIFGTSSMLDGVIRQMKKELPNAKVILTGGEASIIQTYLEEDVIVDDNLLLDGLRIIYQKNQA